MEQKIYLQNGEGYFEIVNVAEITSDNKWKTVMLCSSNGTTVYSDIVIKEGDDVTSIIKSLCEKLEFKLS